LARKIATAKKETAKARAGKNSFPPTPPSFLPAQAEKFLSKFAVRIFVKKSSDFIQKVPPVKTNNMPFDLKIKNNKHENDAEEVEEYSVNYKEEVFYDGAFHRWSAPEHEEYTVGKKFYTYATIFLALLIAYAIYSNSPIMAITFILVGVVGYLYLQKKPRVVNFSITVEGIIAENEIYEFDNLKSFWIFYDPPQEKLLSLRSKSIFTPYIHIPIGDEDPVKIRQILIDFIPEVKQNHNIVDIAERFLHR
jgi:hypothetical protein